MKGMKTLAEVNQKVAELSKNCSDQLVDTRQIWFDDLETIKIEGEPHYLRPSAQQLIALRHGIPLTYLKRCPSDVQSYNLNYWQKQERNEQAFVRFDMGEVRAVFTTKYKPMDNWEILARLEELGYPGKTEVQVNLDHEFFSLSIPDPTKTFSVNGKGDKICLGVSICNSEVGISALRISSFFLRLICTNGLVGKVQVSSAFRHISRKIMSDLPDVLTAVGYQLSRQTAQFKISLETKVAEPKATIQSFNRQFQLDKLEQTAVEYGWEKEAGYTMFHIVNSYTSGSHYPQLPAASSYKLQKVGGQILALVK
jgi:hypothetical protein